VAKTKDLHRVVKHQQEQISALSAASNVTALPPIAPLASDDLNSPPPLPPTASDSEEPKPTPDVAESDTPKPTPDVADAGEEDVSQPTPDVAENSDELKPTPDVGGEEEEERVNKVTDEEGGGESVAKNNDDDEIDEDFYLKDEDDEEVTKKEEENKKKKERESQSFEWQEREAELLARIDEQDKTLKENEERMAKTEDRMELLITQVAKLTRATGLGGGSSAPSRSQLQQPRPRRLNDEKKRREGSSSGSSKSGPSSSSSSSSSASSPDSSSPASGNSTAVAAAEPAESSTSSRLNLWANIRDRIFKASNADSRLLRLTIYDASFFDSARNMKIPLDAHIEIRNITTGQVEKTALVKNAYKPKFNEHFAFKTKQNANDMIMMKILEFDRVGHGSIFGSVALPLDGKHTLGSPIPMPIFDEGLNMKGVVRVAASWAPTYPRKVKVILQGIQDLPENSGATSVACKLLTVSGGSQMGNRRDLVDGGCANFDGEVFDQLTLEHENDHLAMEILLYAEESDEPVFLSKTDIALPSEGQAKDEVVSFTTHKGVPAKLHVKASWND
jgi:hypothetical protein